MEPIVSKKHKPTFNVSALAKRLHVSRISLYKYFELFDLLKPIVDASSTRSFNLDDITKVSPKSAGRYKSNRIEFLNQLSQFYWASLTNNNDLNYRFDETIFKYIPRSMIEENLDKKIAYKRYVENAFNDIKLYEKNLGEKPILKEFELLRLVSAFIKETKGMSRSGEKLQELMDYIEYLRYQLKKVK